MDPLLSIAASIFPELLKLVAADKTGELERTIAKAVKSATGAETPEEAKTKIAADPNITSALQLKLTEIALQAHKTAIDAAERQRLSESAAQKTASDAVALQAQIESGRVSIENTSGARGLLLDILKTNNPLSQPLAWTPSVLSYLIVAGFFGIVGLLVAGWLWPEKIAPSPSSANSGVLQIVNTPAKSEIPVFGGHEVGIGFSGSYTDSGAELEATALAGKRSLRLTATLKLMRPA